MSRVPHVGGVPLFDDYDSASDDDEKVEYLPPEQRDMRERYPRRFSKLPEWKQLGFESLSDYKVAKLWENEYDLLTRSERGPVKVSYVSDSDEEIDFEREHDLLALSEMEDKASQMLASIQKHNPPPSSPLVLAYNSLKIDIKAEKIRLFD